MTEPALPRGGAEGAPCRRCDTRLAVDQRYCLVCGTRRGGAGPIDFSGLLGVSAAPTAVSGAPSRRGRVALLAATWRARGLRGPAPVFATMLLALLGAGIGLGSLSSPRSLASDTVRPVDVVLPAPAATTPPATMTPPAVTPPAPASGTAAVEPATTDIAPAPTATESPATTDTEPRPAASNDDDTASTGAATESDSATPAKSPIKHVFVIRLGDAGVPYPFAASQATPYLKTLVTQGTLLRDLRTVAGSGLADAIALLSGQAPNPQTLAGCPAFADVAPGTVAKDGQEEGEGCVYSAQTATLANQLDAQSLTWRAYVEDQANGGPGVAPNCRRPVAGAPDPWRDPRPGDAYSTVRNPFVYFHAVADAPACETAVTDITTLDTDLAQAAGKVPAFSYIVPSACHDGRAAPCVAGAPAGPATADAFLAALLPKIKASKAWRTSLVVVSFDRAFAAPPATPAADGGKVGALILSPHARAGRVLGGRYDTYSLLAMIEDTFGLERLGRAAEPVKRLGPGVLAEPE